MDTIYRIPAPIPPTCAAFSGLLVFSQVFHPWTLESLRLWTLRRITFIIILIVLYIVAIGVTFNCWIKPHRWSYLALRLLLECSWLNGIGGPILIFWKLSKNGPRIALTTSTAAAVSVQILGFGLSMKPEYGPTGRGITFAGALIFHFNAAIAVNCLHLNSKYWGQRVIVLTVTFTVAAFGVIGIQIGCKDNGDWFLLANNILECLVNLVIILLQLIRRYIQFTASRSRDGVEDAPSEIRLHAEQTFATKRKYDAYHLFVTIPKPIAHGPTSSWASISDVSNTTEV